MTPAQAVAFLPRVRLGDAEAARLRHGVAPAIEAARVEPGSDAPLPPGAAGWPLALLAPDGTLLALAEPWKGRDGPAGPLVLQRVLVGD
jgi:hypothetical protein